MYTFLTFMSLVVAARIQKVASKLDATRAELLAAMDRSWLWRWGTDVSYWKGTPGYCLRILKVALGIFHTIMRHWFMRYVI